MTKPKQKLMSRISPQNSHRIRAVSLVMVDSGR